MFQEEKRNNAPILAAIAFLLLLAAAGAFWFFKKATHASIDAVITHTQVAPLHVQYAHVYGNAGKDQTDDAIYIVANVRINNNLANAPLFLKDMTAHLEPNGLDPLSSTALEQGDLETVLKGLPQVRDAAAKTGSKPLLREIKIEPNSSAEGYAVFQFKCDPKIWNERQAARIDIDFYHNQTVTALFPK